MTQREQTNYYEVLEVEPDAPTTDIHKAYQRARQTYSADNPALYSMFSADEARELLRLIDEAYNVLSNQTTRKNYDESLGSGGTSKVLTPVGGGFSKASSGTAAPSSSPSSGSTSESAQQKQSSAPDVQVISTEPAHPVRATQMPQPANNSLDSTDSFGVRRREASKPALPSGTGRTQLSTYKLDDSFETEIADASEFDGGFLQRIRLYKNISIDKMSDSTRISRSYLMAVETNDYKNLPAAVFVRGFVVQVARQLGIDEAKAAASYMKLFKAGGGK